MRSAPLRGVRRRQRALELLIIVPAVALGLLALADTSASAAVLHQSECEALTKYKVAASAVLTVGKEEIGVPKATSEVTVEVDSGWPRSQDLLTEKPDSDTFACLPLPRQYPLNHIRYEAKLVGKKTIIKATVTDNMQSFEDRIWDLTHRGRYWSIAFAPTNQREGVIWSSIAVQVHGDLKITEVVPQPNVFSGQGLVSWTKPTKATRLKPGEPRTSLIYEGWLGQQMGSDPGTDFYRQAVSAASNIAVFAFALYLFRKRRHKVHPVRSGGRWASIDLLAAGRLVSLAGLIYSARSY
jgi:hypothetical protein